MDFSEICEKAANVEGGAEAVIESIHSYLEEIKGQIARAQESGRLYREPSLILWLETVALGLDDIPRLWQWREYEYDLLLDAIFGDYFPTDVKEGYREVIRYAIETDKVLDAKNRAVLFLRFVKRLTLRESAHILEYRSSQTIRNREIEAIRKLRHPSLRSPKMLERARIWSEQGLEIDEPSAPEPPKPQGLDALAISARPRNALHRAGIRTVEQARSLDDETLLSIRNIGEDSLREIRRAVGPCTNPTPLPPMQPSRPERKLEEIAGDATVMWRDRCIFLKTVTFLSEGRCVIMCRELGVSAGGTTHEEAMKTFITAVSSHLDALEDKGQLEQALAYLTPPSPSEETSGEFLWTWKDRSIRLDYVLRRYDHDGHYQMLLPQLAISATGETEESMREELLGQAARRLQMLDDGQGSLDRVLFHINATPPTPSQPSPDLPDEVASSLPVPRSSE